MAIAKQVEILLPTAVDRGFDYRAEAGMELAPGDIVSVPFGRGQSLGVVWGEGKADLPAGKIKSVAVKHGEFPPLSQPMLDFIDWASWYNCAPKGAVLKMVLPIDDIGKKARKDTLAHVETHLDMKEIALAKFSDMQADAARALEEKIGKGFSVTLLDGVTGSGKTEVYFDAVAGVLKENKKNQVLVMLPEIALSVQWLERFEKRFGTRPLIWNSQVSPARKRVTWQAIAKGEARVVVGARSALFLPYKNLSLIIADEEHDQSYKQEDGVIYHARDMAVARARFGNIPALLVSATPSLESVFNVTQKKYTEVSLPARHNQASLPDIHMIDMRSAELARGSFISQPLRDKLTATVASGQQAMLFLNRRGYAPLVLCRACGYRFQCPECSAWLVMHAHNGRERLECHHCGYRLPMPDTCPECSAKDNLHACGPGVERVHEEVKTFLPEARIAVMASDNMDSYADLTETITAMEERRIDILIGTQMMAKGHHFAGLALVGVVDADLGLSGGDPRASERTYQLLHQMGGRAGRESVRGEVHLQSYLPEHPVMKALLAGDRQAFFDAELAARKKAFMPPFSRLAAVILESAKEDQVMRTAKELAATAQPQLNLQILGPAPAPLFMLRGKFRYRFLVKADRVLNLPDFMRGWIATVTPPSSVRIKLDIDPVSFV